MNTEIKLNLGSGFRKIDGFINIDNRHECEPDLICDVIAGLPFDDSSVDYITAFDFLEHLQNDDVIPVVEEIYRCLKEGSVFEHLTPSSDGRGLWQDFKHKSHWNINSNLYWTSEEYRKLYDINAFFDIISIRDIITNDSLHIIHTHAVLKKRCINVVR